MPDVNKGCMFAAVLLVLFGWGMGKVLDWLFSFVDISLAFPH